MTVATVTLVTACGWLFLTNDSPLDENHQTHIVARGDVVVACIQPGTVTSVRSTELHCEVEAATYDGYLAAGAEVLWIVANGTNVKQGDLLVELNDTLLQELRDDWHLKVVGSEGEYRQADIGYQNQLSKRETELANALTQLESAESLKWAAEGIREIELAVVAEEARTSAEGVKVQQLLVEIAEAMDRIGAAGSLTDTPQEARLKYQTEIMKLGQALGDLEMMKKFEHPLQAEEMQAAVKMARNALLQSQRDHEAALQQLASQRDAAAKTLSVQRERLQHCERQIAKCAIHAPHDGVAVYATRGGTEAIGPGAVLREHEPILTLHDLSTLQWKVLLPKADADQVEVGLPATIECEPADGHLYHGTVAAMEQSGADTWTFIAPHGGPPLRLDASAMIEIPVTSLSNVLRIPRQAAISRDGQTVAYVMARRGWQPREVKLGAVGTRFVEVTDGLTEGETVALNASLVESQTREVD